jgi:phage shock protein A
MTDNNDPKYRELITRIAQLEYRITKLENTQGQLENTMTPGGYITEAFDRVYSEIDQFKAEVKAEMRELNAKIDVILQHVTGMNKDNSDP